MATASAVAPGLSIDDIAVRIGAKLQAVRRSPTDTIALAALRHEIDSNQIRDDTLLAENEDYRYLFQELLEFCERSPEVPCSMADLRLFYTLKALMAEIPALSTDRTVQNSLLRDAVTWYHRQGQQQQQHVTTRLATNRFADYNRHTMAFWPLTSTTKVRTRDLAAAHPNRAPEGRSGFTPAPIIGEMKGWQRPPPLSVLKAAQPDSTVALIEGGCAQAADSSPEAPSTEEGRAPVASRGLGRAATFAELDAIYLRGRHREATQAYVERQVRDKVELWAADRSRHVESIVQRQVLPRTQSLPCLHFTANAYSKNQSWKLSPGRHDLPTTSASNADLDVISCDTADAVHVPMMSWPATPLRADSRLTPQGVVDARQSLMRSLFNPQTALTIDLRAPSQALVETIPAPTTHELRCDELKCAARCKWKLTRAGINIGRGVIERALVQYGVSLTPADRKTLFPRPDDGLLMDPTGEASQNAAKANKVAKGKKGKKSKKKKK